MLKFFLVSALAVVSLGVFAQGAKPVQKTVKKTIKCAVQGDVVNVANATSKKMYADYKGNRYFFCCNGCPQAFKANPAKYAKSESIPTPKPAKTAKSLN